MWLFITVLLVVISAEVNRTNDEKITNEEDESDEEDSEEEQYDDDDEEEFEKDEKDSLTDGIIKSENQSESHPPAFGPRSTNVIKLS
ncbi:unnamed protein product [Acanthocheilonema viteae]|uniref:Translocon-associated protein subunit alpha n=1 Tax=Acanthocheilonema viteae TaxID=6277 RepID=A0A498SG13_ACAVI|nr:unnamed protein product [Acanthocheilonema viteae]